MVDVVAGDVGHVEGEENQVAYTSQHCSTVACKDQRRAA